MNITSEMILAADLERLCPRCRGQGGDTELGCWYSCGECNGAGYIPTEYGKKVLALMRHNFKPTLRDAQGD
jgi:DnaJ-class molecular chaperone